jgi:uncharacterized protein YlxW (UPF0749 family)
VTNPFSRIHNEKWVYPVSAMSAILGFMMVAAWLSPKTRDSRYQLLSADQKGRVSENVIDLNEYIKLQQEVDMLRKRATALERGISDGSKGSAALNTQLQEIKAVACLTELEGPGVKVVLKDNANAGPAPIDLDLIHDMDVLRVVNELFASDAEGVAVNGQRVKSGSWIRCAGPTILVDGIKIAAPYVVTAIGNPETLYNGFTIKGGVMTEIATANPTMVQVTKEKSLRLPPYLGATTRKFASVPKESGK